MIELILFKSISNLLFIIYKLKYLDKVKVQLVGVMAYSLSDFSVWFPFMLEGFIFINEKSETLLRPYQYCNLLGEVYRFNSRSILKLSMFFLCWV